MAKAKSDGVTLKLDFDEATALKKLLESEKWPSDGHAAGELNEIYDELLGVLEG